MIRVKAARADITAIVGYPPPTSGRTMAKAVRETVGGIRGKLEAAPQRTCCLVGLDNVGVATGGVDGIGTKNLSAQETGGTEDSE